MNYSRYISNYFANGAFVKISFALFLVLLSHVLFSQVINGYARVTAISAGTTFTVANVNETGDTFEDGEAVIVMQMQDDVIGVNTGNNASFGDLSSIQSSGLYEVRFIASHIESAGIPTSITLSSSTTNTYNINANSSVQLITFPSFGAPDYTTTGNFSALDWDGNVGGVLAFEVPGALTLAHNLSANGDGFRGGSRSANFYSGGTGCFPTGNFIRTANHTRAAQKGEGIYRTANIDHLYAKGKLLNGGGGGAERINSGGGGGGNFSSGGNGGFGWSCGTAPGGGGIGGIDLSTNISASRVFMGGGGGGGQQNNSASTDGSDGGGIIIVRANEINTIGSCAGRSITSNGLNVPNGGNDGQGGGGAGGSVVFQVNAWNINGTCPLTISANGGNGGSVNSSTHAGGGGGGQGVIIFSSAQPTNNITTNTNNGAGGCNNNSSPCNNQASSGQGAVGSGIIPNSSGPLPIELIEFKASLSVDGVVELSWKTSSEINNDFFTVERSLDLYSWESILTLEGRGNSNQLTEYYALDLAPMEGVSYYRLSQTDVDGNSSSFSVEIIENMTISNNEIRVYPNPFDSKISVSGFSEGEKTSRIYNEVGQDLTTEVMIISTSKNLIELDLSKLDSGFYILKVGAIVRKVHKL